MLLSQEKCSDLGVGGVLEDESPELRKTSNSCACGVAGLLESGDSRDKFTFLLPVSYWLLPTTVFQDDPGWHSWLGMGRMRGALEEELDSWPSSVGTLSTVSVQGLIDLCGQKPFTLLSY